MSIERTDIYDMIEQEAQAQERRWGRNTEPPRRNTWPNEWFLIFMEEVGEAAKEMNEVHFREKGLLPFMAEMVQALAVGVSMLEAMKAGGWY